MASTTPPRPPANGHHPVPAAAQADGAAAAAGLLRPPGCVLVLVDLQNDFCHPDGACARMGQDITPVQRMLPAVIDLISLARTFEIPTVFLRVTHSSWFNTDGWVRRGASGHTLSGDVPIVAEETWGAEFCQVSPGPNDLVVTKHRYSGFDHTELELALRAKQCRTVVLAGTQTNVCVRETAFDAVALGFDVIVVRECVSSTVPELHEASLIDISERAGHVLPLAEMKEAWPTPERSPQAGSRG